MEYIELIEARGHPNLRATHKTTLEITKDPYLTLRGDCIIAVEADKAAKDLSPEFKRLASSEGGIITLRIEAEDFYDTVRGFGSPKLLFTDGGSMVFRKSSYSCSRTVMIKADKAAVDLNRRLVEALRKGSTRVKLILKVELGSKEGL